MRIALYHNEEVCKIYEEERGRMIKGVDFKEKNGFIVGRST